MRHLLLALVLSIAVTCVFADTLTVKLDGTGDYSDIQNAVGWSASGDVILVYPGIYYENIDCYGRDSLTIASLYLLNPDDSNIHNTIINGNQTGTCIVAFRGEQNLRITGFTITNALPDLNEYSYFNNGGGLYFDDVSVLVEHCIITKNTADMGGGILAFDSYVSLSKTRICYNHALLGGGINTIHLADGEYSYLNGNKFPIGLKKHVALIGESVDNTVINLDSMVAFCYGSPIQKEIILKNFTVKNGNTDSLFSASAVLFIHDCDRINIDSVVFRNCSGKGWSNVFYIINCDSVFIKNSSFLENHVVNCITISEEMSADVPYYAELSGCRIAKNFPPRYPDYYNFNSALFFYYTGEGENHLTTRIINCEVSDNMADKPDTGYVYAVSSPGIRLSNRTITHIVNSTIGNNTTPYDLTAGLDVSYGAKAYLYNTILYGNEPYQIILFEGDTEVNTEVNLYYCLVQDGENGILNRSPESAFVFYDTTNLEGNPGWINAGEFPYALSGDSPCINTGTQNLPGGINLPETDLTGSPRISGGELDIGAYEFLFVGLNEDGLKRVSGYFIASPNPFNDLFNIILSGSLVGNQVEITLYDLTGNLIATIFEGKLAGTTILWRPGEQAQIRPGIYLLKLRSDSSFMETIKVIKI